MENEHIRKFLHGWKRERDYYERLAKRAGNICKRELQNSAIKAQVTFRAKDICSLRNKLVQRNCATLGGYQSEDDIRADIIDLAGVRIALYFPNHLVMAEKIISKEFKVHKMVQHGGDTNSYDMRLVVADVACVSGYRAKHYRVSMLNTESDQDRGVKPDIIEIQVVSMLHHTVAEVGHDSYKQKSGLPSTEVEQILGRIGGVAQIGGALLEQLHDVQQAPSESRNIKFANQDELLTFLSTQQLPSEFSMGSLNILHQFLGTVGYDNPRDLTAVIGRLEDSEWNADQEFISEIQDTTSLKPNVSAILVASILSRIENEDELQEKAREAGDQEVYQLKVMVSTITLLNELFPPVTRWIRKLSVVSGRKGLPNPECFTWMQTTANLQGLLEGKIELSDDQRAAIKVPWAWFHAQSNCIITLAFRVSKLGLSPSWTSLGR